MNDSSHQKKYPEWRIPLHRIPEVCFVLKATNDERDDLMLARLREIQENDQKSDVLVVLNWLTPVITELAARPLLNAHKRQVLSAFDRACAATPGADDLPSPLPLDDKLEMFLEKWMTRAVNDYIAECSAHDEADTLHHDPLQIDREKKVKAVLAKRKAALKSCAPSRHEMQKMVRALRKAIREVG